MNSNIRTTLERVIVIFAIIIGVIGFYFVVSNINSIISNSIKKNKNFTICMTKLEKLKKKYDIDEKIYKLAKRALIKEDFKKEVFDFIPMMVSFPKSLKKKLKYDMYINMFGGFRFLKDLPMETVISIGNKMKEVVYQKSKDCNLEAGDNIRELASLHGSEIYICICLD